MKLLILKFILYNNNINYLKKKYVIRIINMADEKVDYLDVDTPINGQNYCMYIIF